MKKVFFLYAAIALFVTSCTNKPLTTPSPTLPTLFFEGKDTTVMDSCQNYISKEYRYKTCSGDKRTGYHLVAEGMNRNVHIIKQQGGVVPKDSLKKLLHPYTTSISTPSDSGNWEWLWTILKWIGAIALLLFVLWLVRELILFMINNAGSIKKSNGIPDAASKLPPTSSDPTPKTITEVTGLVAAISKGGGGTVNMAGLVIEIYGTDAPLVHVENSGTGAHSGNIDVLIGNIAGGYPEKVDVTSHTSVKEDMKSSDVPK